ncbi:MAG: hypothetical protein JW847_05580 [Candidatus Omnitrophica bacterium]|nr:hypothetical protein [Candidatus Omnitrophota bacterium]
MLRALKNRNAQAVMGEYVVVIFLVMAVLMAMTMYFKRALQARIHDARDYMVTEVRARSAGSFNGDLYREYEPYYTNTLSNVARAIEFETRLLPSGSSGIFQKIFNEILSVSVNSETAPPRDYNLTTPTR